MPPKKTEVCIIYQTDPLGTVAGGIDSFIRGILGAAPDDISMHMVGITTDPEKRPTGKWTECYIHGRPFQFYPVSSTDSLSIQRRIPLSVRLMISLLLKRLPRFIDIIEFHRIEPVLGFLLSKRPINLFMHQDMTVIRKKNCDIRWKHAPWLYFKLEALLLSKIKSLFAVRKNAVDAYRTRYPTMAEKFRFLPTWMDPNIFSPIPEQEKEALKNKLANSYGFNKKDLLLNTVGRLDHQKDPLLLLNSFKILLNEESNTSLIMIGEGVLKGKVKEHILKLGLSEKVILAGLRNPWEIADLHRVSDVFVLSSVYEGMPICVLEALGCGLPVATTEVGEVRMIVKPEENGEIALSRTPRALAQAIANCLKKRETYKGAPCTNAVQKFVPEKVLEPVYENYRRLANQAKI